MCEHCDALDDTDRLIALLNKLLETEFDYAGDYKYAKDKFREVSMF